MTAPPVTTGFAAATGGGRDARRKAWLAFAGFFFLIGGYALLKPVRDAVFLQRLGFLRMPLFDALVAAGSLAVVIAYNLVAVRLPRRLLVNAGFLAFLGGVALCAVLLAGGEAGPAAGFYVGLNLSWLLLLAVFWSIVNDVFWVEEGRRWYGLIALSGPVGALAGSALASALVRPIGAVALLWVALGLFGVAWVLVACLDVEGRHHPPPSRPAVILPAVFPDVRLLLRSRYVLWIAGLMLLGVFAMKIYTLDFYRLLNLHAADQDAKTLWSANKNIAVNGLGVLIQIGVTPFVLRRRGPGTALSILPVLSLAGGLALASHEVFFVAFVVVAAGEGLAYTINQSAKELLYVPGDRFVKYQAKALVDVFCFRVGDASASLLVAGTLAAFPLSQVPWAYKPLLLVAMAASGVWLACARLAGRAFDQVTRGGPPEGVGAEAPKAR